jgi:hypothetical protein
MTALQDGFSARKAFVVMVSEVVMESDKGEGIPLESSSIGSLKKTMQCENDDAPVELLDTHTL